MHLLNFAILIVTLFCFEFFWRELLAVREEGAWAGASRQYAWAMGYLLFANMYLDSFSSYHWDSELGIVTPDLVVAGVMFLVFGMILRFADGRMGMVSAAIYGLTLGIGYLAKTAMLPFGFVVLATMIGIAWKRRSGLMQVGLYVAELSQCSMERKAKVGTAVATTAKDSLFLCERNARRDS